MKHLISLVSLISVLVSTSAFAGREEYDSCILEYMKGTKHDIAANLIKRACSENYENPRSTTDRRRAYNNCLLENLVGVESLQAVTEIKSACDRKYL